MGLEEYITDYLGEVAITVTATSLMVFISKIFNSRTDELMMLQTSPYIIGTSILWIS